MLPLHRMKEFGRDSSEFSGLGRSALVLALKSHRAHPGGMEEILVQKRDTQHRLCNSPHATQLLQVLNIPPKTFLCNQLQVGLVPIVWRLGGKELEVKGIDLKHPMTSALGFAGQHPSQNGTIATKSAS